MYFSFEFWKSEMKLNSFLFCFLWYKIYFFHYKMAYNFQSIRVQLIFSVRIG